MFNNRFVKGITILIGSVLFAFGLANADSSKISVTEGIAVKNGHHKEAVFYYENNWLAFRKEALKLGYIDSYELIVSENDDDDADILLVTNFSSRAQFNAIEERYKNLTQGKELQLLNDIPPKEFRQSVFIFTGKNKWTGGK